MTGRLKKQALDGRNESNNTAVKLNDLAKRIRKITRSMMGMVSELSMHQALSLSLYQEKTEKEALLTDARERMKEAGTPLIPWEAVELDIKREEKKRLRKDLDKKRALEIQAREIAKTTGQFVDL